MKRAARILWLSGAFAVMGMVVLALSLIALLRFSGGGMQAGAGIPQPRIGALRASLTQPATFSDVTAGSPLASALAALAEDGIVAAGADGKFRPNDPVNRAEVAKMLTEAVHARERAGFPFRDVPASAWFAPYVDAAATAGIVRGYGDGTFGPQRLINKGEAAAMLLRAFKVVPPVVPQGAPWYAAPMTGLQRLRVIEGPTDPFATVTRGEMALMTYRLLHPDDASAAHAAASASSSASSIPVLTLPLPRAGRSSSRSSSASIRRSFRGMLLPASRRDAVRSLPAPSCA